MTKVYSVAGQAAPVANTATDLFVVPAGKYFVGSTINVANRSPNTNAAYRIAVVKSGETLDNKHYLVYDKFIAMRDNKPFTLGLTLGAGDKIVVYGSTANLSFSLFGVTNDVAGA